MPESNLDSLSAAAMRPQALKVGFIQPVVGSEDDSDDESVEDDECEDEKRAYDNINDAGFMYPICIGDVIETRTQGVEHVLERYRIVHRLGHGSSSIVWLAHETEHRKTVALKIMNAGDSTKYRKREYYMQKAIKESGVDKTHILLYENWFTLKGPTQNHLVLVLQATGPSLYTFGHDQSIKCRMSAAKQSLEALRSLHQVGLVHGGKLSDLLTFSGTLS